MTAAGREEEVERENENEVLENCRRRDERGARALARKSRLVISRDSLSWRRRRAAAVSAVSLVSTSLSLARDDNVKAKEERKKGTHIPETLIRRKL